MTSYGMNTSPATHLLRAWPPASAFSISAAEPAMERPRWLAPRSRSRSGIDLVPNATARGRRFSCKLPPIALPFTPESFDLITAFEVIEHLTGLGANARRSAPRAAPRRSLSGLHAEQILPMPNRAPTPDRIRFTFTNSSTRNFKTRSTRFSRPSPSISRIASRRSRSLTRRHLLKVSRAGRRRAGTGAILPRRLCAQPSISDRWFCLLSHCSNLLLERERHIRKLQDELALIEGLARATHFRTRSTARQTYRADVASGTTKSLGTGS